MIYNLIIDVGSSKADWAMLDRHGVELKRVRTEGFNSLMAERDDITAVAREAFQLLGAENAPASMTLYGAGCSTPEICHKVEDAMRQSLGCDEVEAYSDLLGAARSLLGKDSGIACILGTGSNSCLYDGEKIVSNTPSLGYLLGDEGSGCAIGKRLLSHAFKGHLPKLITDALKEETGLDLPSLLENVYRRPAPNKFLASFVPFVRKRMSNPYIYSLVRREFESFLARNVSQYPGARQLPVNFTGGVAFAFAEVLRKTCADQGFKVGSISAQPLDGLVKFHSDILSKDLA